MTYDKFLGNLRRRHDVSLSAAGPGRTDCHFQLFLAAGFALAAVALSLDWGYRIGFEAVHGIAGYLSPGFLETLTYFGDSLLAICFMAAFAQRQPRVVWMGVLASLYAAVLSHAMKSAFNADRPPAVLGRALEVIGPTWTHHSFPSGHTVTIFVAAACFSIGASRKAKAFYYGLAVAVGLSRVWVGVHWPVDVLAGAAVAALSVALAIQTMKSARWGLGLAPHLFFVAAIAACGVAELVRVPEYPLAQPVSMMIALAALAILARDYLYRPLTLKSPVEEPSVGVAVALADIPAPK